MTALPNKTSNLTKAFRALGLLLLVYTFFMTFSVPLGPGIEDITVMRQEWDENGALYEIEIQGHSTHFASSEPVVFMKRKNQILNATELKVLNDVQLKCKVELPKFVPSQSFDVFVNGKQDGTISFANGFFAEGLEVLPKARVRSDETVLDRLHPRELGFHFPFQPNIMESIRNLMLHVPMWFTMFLLMGISFAQSIRTLSLGGDEDRDLRAVAAVKVGLWFGVLGLLTGSLWARFTWGAWWVDDPQLNGAFVTVMVYAGYLVLRGSVQDPKLRSRLSAVYNLFGFCLLVVLLMVLPRFTESLHPGKGGNPAFSSYDLDSALRAVFYPAVLGWMILGTWMYSLARKIESVKASRPQVVPNQFTASIPCIMLAVVDGNDLNATFEASGKMPVVVGVAVIIVLGLGGWWFRALRQWKRLQRQSPVDLPQP